MKFCSLIQLSQSIVAAVCIFFVTVQIILHINVTSVKLKGDGDSISTNRKTFVPVVQSHFEWFEQLTLVNSAHKNNEIAQWKEFVGSWRLQNSLRPTYDSGGLQYLFPTDQIPMSHGLSTSCSYDTLTDSKNMVIIINKVLCRDQMSFINIFSHMDNILTIIDDVLNSHADDGLLLVWNDIFLAKHLSNGDKSDPVIRSPPDFELFYLYHNLVIEYVIKQRGVIVTFSSVDIDDVEYSARLSAQLQLLGDVITMHEKETHEMTGDSTSTSKQHNSTMSIIRHHIATLRNRLNTTSNHNTLYSLCGHLVYNRQYDSRCLPTMRYVHGSSMRGDDYSKPPHSNVKNNKGLFPLLVTGLGGCGSHSLANTLRGAGYEVRHEDIDRDGAVSWLYSANDFSLDMPYPHGPIEGDSFLTPRFLVTYHLVRHPLRQIASFTAHTNATYDFVLRWVEKTIRESAVRAQFREARVLQHTCPRGGRCHLLFATLTWVYWNRFVASFAQGTYRVESINDLYASICTQHVFPKRIRTDPQLCLERIKSSELKQQQQQQQDEKDRFRSTFSLLFPFLHISPSFHGSAAHKRHIAYSLSDLRAVDGDGQLAQIVIRDALRYGYVLKELK